MISNKNSVEHSMKRCCSLFDTWLKQRSEEPVEALDANKIVFCIDNNRQKGPKHTNGKRSKSLS